MEKWCECGCTKDMVNRHTTTTKVKEEEEKKPVVARALDFEGVASEAKSCTPKSSIRNKGLFRSLRKDSPMRKAMSAASPSLSIVRKRKYLLCSPKIKADQVKSLRSPRKKKVKKQQKADNKANAEPSTTTSPDFSRFKARALEDNLPVIPFYLTEEEEEVSSLPTPSVVRQSSDDYVEMTPQASVTPAVSRQSFLPPNSTMTSGGGSSYKSKGHCRSCTCPDHKSRRLPPLPPPSFEGMKHTQL